MGKVTSELEGSPGMEKGYTDPVCASLGFGEGGKPGVWQCGKVRFVRVGCCE